MQSEPKARTQASRPRAAPRTPLHLEDCLSCPVVDGVSFYYSAVNSWRAEAVTHSSKFSPVVTFTCSLASLFKAQMTAVLRLEWRTRLKNWDCLKSDADWKLLHLLPPFSPQMIYPLFKIQGQDGIITFPVNFK